jgi:hypothetical protein
MSHPSVPVGVALILALVSAAPRPAAAASPRGAMACTLVGDVDYRPALYSPSVVDEKRRVSVKAMSVASDCDDAGVQRGVGDITKATLKLVGKMPKGTSCADLLADPTFEKGIITVRWKGPSTRINPQLKTIGTSRARLASASFDDENDALVLVTEPIPRGAFAGASITVRLGLEGLAHFRELCSDGSVGFLSQHFGDTNTSTLSVQNAAQ